MSMKVWVKNHVPQLLLGSGIIGYGVTIALAVKATPKAMEMLNKKKDELGVDKLDVKTTVKTAYKPYIPTAIAAGISTGLVIASDRVHVNKEVAATVATQVAVNALDNYKKSVDKVVGTEKAAEIEQATAQRLVDGSSIPTDKADIPYAGGNELCIDAFTGRIFLCSSDIIRRAECEMNNYIRNNDYGSLNDWYDILGLKGIEPLGSEYGWSYEKGGIEIEFKSCLLENDKPCLVMDYRVMPYRDYDVFTDRRW